MRVYEGITYSDHYLLANSSPNYCLQRKSKSKAAVRSSDCRFGTLKVHSPPSCVFLLVCFVCIVVFNRTMEKRYVSVFFSYLYNTNGKEETCLLGGFFLISSVLFQE